MGEDEEDEFSIWNGSSVFFPSGQFYCFSQWKGNACLTNLVSRPHFIDMINLEMLKCLSSAMPGAHTGPFQTNSQFFPFQPGDLSPTLSRVLG